MNSSCVERQPLSRREAEVTVRMRALVAIVDVRVEMDVVFCFRAELLATVCREREGGEGRRKEGRGEGRRERGEKGKWRRERMRKVDGGREERK